MSEAPPGNFEIYELADVRAGGIDNLTYMCAGQISKYSSTDSMKSKRLISIPHKQPCVEE